MGWIEYNHAPNCPAMSPMTTLQGQKRPNLPRGGHNGCTPGAKTAQFAPRWPQRLHPRGKNGPICPAMNPMTTHQGQKRPNQDIMGLAWGIVRKAASFSAVASGKVHGSGAGFRNPVEERTQFRLPSLSKQHLERRKGCF